MNRINLVRAFFRASLQQELAYKTNAYIQMLHSIINLATGAAALAILFSRVENVRGWSFASTLALLGVYFCLGALRGLFLGPSLDALVGMEGEVWSGRFDFTLLRPVSVQFMASFRHWRPFALLDVLLGLAVLGYAMFLPGQNLTWLQVAAFLIALGSAMVILYSVLLAFAALVFWSPGFLFTWVFDALFQLARYPVGIYPPWLRFVLTWIIPVGVMTTVPVQALTGVGNWQSLAGSLLIALVLLLASSGLFRIGLRRYGSASS